MSTFYYTKYSEYPDSFLSEWLGDYAQEWSDEFRDYWELDADEPSDAMDETTWKLYRILDQIVDKYSQAARTLHQVGGEDYGATIRKIRKERDLDLTKLPFVRQRFEIEIFQELDKSLLEKADRALELLELTVSVENRHARRYLERVAECYIRGLSTETVVMCGAVLEAALRDFANDDEVRSGLDDLHYNSRVYTGHRLAYIKEQELLSPAVVDKAMEINDDRNDAVHFTPGIVAEPKKNIELLAHVLRALEPPEWMDTS